MRRDTAIISLAATCGLSIMSCSSASRVRMAQRTSVLAVQEAERGSPSSRPISPSRLPSPSTVTVIGSTRLTTMFSTVTSPSSTSSMKPVLRVSPSLMKVVPSSILRGCM